MKLEFYHPQITNPAVIEFERRGCCTMVAIKAPDAMKHLLGKTSISAKTWLLHNGYRSVKSISSKPTNAAVAGNPQPASDSPGPQGKTNQVMRQADSLQTEPVSPRLSDSSPSGSLPENTSPNVAGRSLENSEVSG